MRYKTYADIAKAIGIEYCNGIGPGADRTHDSGFVSSRPWTIHWTERRVTRSGIRRFLIVAWDIIDADAATARHGWQGLWDRTKWVRQTASETLHVTIPAELWAEDKARLAARLTDVDITRDREAKRALRWTQR